MDNAIKFLAAVLFLGLFAYLGAATSWRALKLIEKPLPRAQYKGTLRLAGLSARCGLIGASLSILLSICLLFFCSR